MIDIDFKTPRAVAVAMFEAANLFTERSQQFDICSPESDAWRQVASSLNEAAHRIVFGPRIRD